MGILHFWAGEARNSVFGRRISPTGRFNMELLGLALKLSSMKLS